MASLLIPILIVLAAIILFAGALILLRTAGSLSTPPPVEPAPELDFAPAIIAEHLGSAIRCETVSTLEGENPNRAAFLQLHRVLERWYPRVHEYLVRDYINEYSLLYTWKGSQPEQPGILLAAHQDVVPADPATADSWTRAPFGGEIADGYVWGRGALDLKSQLVTILDAVEQLIVSGYRPERTVYLAFGHDEEIGGHNGAEAIKEHLKGRGIELAAVLDEGGMVAAPGLLTGVDIPVALVGVAEKGYLALKLTVEAPPWHAAMPPRTTAIGILARAIGRLEAQPMPARLSWVRAIYRGVGGAASPLIQMMFANGWLFGGAVRSRLEKSPETNAAIRTTHAATVIHGGIKDNVLPRRAEVIFNFRLLPGDTIAAACEHARKAIDDPRVQIEALPNAAWEASPVSPLDSPAYLGLEETIRRRFNSIPVSPYLVVGATDARRYVELSENVYRFSPYMVAEDDIRRIHGIDERIAVESLGRMAAFYYDLVRCWAGEAGEEAVSS
jgi:carboxypeptidase PM20D1